VRNIRLFYDRTRRAQNLTPWTEERVGNCGWPPVGRGPNSLKTVGKGIRRIIEKMELGHGKFERE